MTNPDTVSTESTEAECRAFAVAIRAHHRGESEHTDSHLATLGITRLGGGANNAVYRCSSGERACCIKVYRTDGRDRDEREWLALTLLADRCPGVAPRPLWRDADPALPLVALEVVPGHSLRDRTLGLREFAALSAALRQIQGITPPGAAFPFRSAGAAVELLARVDAWLTEDDTTAASDLCEVRELARRRLAEGGRALLLAPAPAIFSRGDPNLANCLWDADGDRVRLIDFEYAGWGDLAGDLADLIEGPWARHVREDEWFAFAATLGLHDPAGDPRFRAARSVCATFWVMKFAELLARDPNDARSATLTHQIARTRQFLQESA